MHDRRDDPAFPATYSSHRPGITLRQLAALILRVTDSGTAWMDEMIAKASDARSADDATAVAERQEPVGVVAVTPISEISFRWHRKPTHGEQLYAAPQPTGSATEPVKVESDVFTQEVKNANELLRLLNLDPEEYRTDCGYINLPKVKAAVRAPWWGYPTIEPVNPPTAPVGAANLFDADPLLTGEGWAKMPQGASPLPEFGTMTIGDKTYKTMGGYLMGEVTTLPEDVVEMVTECRKYEKEALASSNRAFYGGIADMIERLAHRIAKLEAERIAAPLPDDVARMVERLRNDHDRNYEDEAADMLEQQQHRIAKLEAQYHELIMAVGNKFQGETRHQTALRYILAAEAPRAIDAFMSAAPKEG